MSVTNLYKNRGLKVIGNERGIFNLSKVISIFDKIIYSDVYDTVDQEGDSTEISETTCENATIDS